MGEACSSPSRLMRASMPRVASTSRSGGQCLSARAELMHTERVHPRGWQGSWTAASCQPASRGGCAAKALAQGLQRGALAGSELRRAGLALAAKSLWGAAGGSAASELTPGALADAVDTLLVGLVAQLAAPSTVSDSGIQVLLAARPCLVAVAPACAQVQAGLCVVGASSSHPQNYRIPSPTPLLPWACNLLSSEAPSPAAHGTAVLRKACQRELAASQ